MLLLWNEAEILAMHIACAFITTALAANQLTDFLGFTFINQNGNPE